jgi:dehydrogenase/reductase SDR family member 7B
MTKIKGSTIWITGASSGIGEALVYAAAEEAGKIIISSRKKETLEKVKSQCPAAVQEKIHILDLDLEDLESLPGKAKEVLDQHGFVDIIIHSGGVSQRSLVKETQLSVDQRIMNINFFGSVALTKALLPFMLEKKKGHFVAISSLVGKFGTPYRSAYAASKHALHGFFDSLRYEHWQDQIQVSIICPGFIKTQVSVNALTGDGQPLNEMDNAQANGMSPEECAKSILSAIEKNKSEVYIGGREVMGIYVKRFFPKLFNKIIRKAAVR